MKKIKIILPFLAFMFAIVAAFALDQSKNYTGATFLYAQSQSNPCVQCLSDITDPGLCSEQPGIACQCEAQDASTVSAKMGDTSDCSFAFRPEP